MLVAGVDGCKAGWLIVRAEVASAGLRIVGDPRTAPSFSEVLDLTRHCDAVAVDIPIGLSENEYWRQADLEARCMLGRRKSSVFAAPIQPTLAATLCTDYRASYVLACELSQRWSGKRMSPYAHGILKKVKEANEALTPALQDYVVEVHPEVSFCAMNGAPMQYSKKGPEGQYERRQVLLSWFDSLSIVLPRRTELDDLFDASAAAWSAVRLADRKHGSLPRDPPLGWRDLRMKIVY